MRDAPDLHSDLNWFHACRIHWYLFPSSEIPFYWWICLGSIFFLKLKACLVLSPSFCWSSIGTCYHPKTIFSYFNFNQTFALSCSGSLNQFASLQHWCLKCFWPCFYEMGTKMATYPSKCLYSSEIAQMGISSFFY